MTKIIVTGIGGRMGSRIAQLIDETPGTELVGATETAGSFAIGTTLQSGHPIVDTLEKCIARADVVIDFTAPAATLQNAEIARAHGKAMVIGTTGFSTEDKRQLTKILEVIPSVWAPNMSIGVNILLQVVAEAASLLGSDYDIEIVEAHHRHKKDAPSGTALALAEAVAKATKRNLANVACFERHGQIGARRNDEIGIQTLRGGDIVGDHTVLFAGSGERLEFTHRATSRDNFARGAILAAQWVAGKPAGIYGMNDVLNLN